MTNRQSSHSWPQERPITASRPNSARASLSDQVPSPDRSVLRLATAERVVAEAYASAKWGAVDIETINVALAVARDCLAEARELGARAQAELAFARQERMQAQRERTDRSLPRPAEPSADPIISDAPGTPHCPDPRDAHTAPELMEQLRLFWLWAGQPSYRSMARQCGNRYAASTLHTALRSEKLISLDMLLAVVDGCRGGAEHRQAFASAWRRLQMESLRTGRAAVGSRALRPVRDTA
jgi:hypothetical protein